MTTVLVFIYQESPAQLAAGSMICFMFLLINIACTPYCTSGLNSLASFTLVAQFLTLFSGIMIALVDQQTAENEIIRQSDQAVVGTIVFAANVMTLSWPLIRQIWSGNHLNYYHLLRSLSRQTLKTLGRMYACCCGVTQAKSTDHTSESNALCVCMGAGVRLRECFGLPRALGREQESSCVCNALANCGAPCRAHLAAVGASAPVIMM